MWVCPCAACDLCTPISSSVLLLGPLSVCSVTPISWLGGGHAVSCFSIHINKSLVVLRWLVVGLVLMMVYLSSFEWRARVNLTDSLWENLCLKYQELVCDLECHTCLERTKPSGLELECCSSLVAYFSLHRMTISCICLSVHASACLSGMCPCFLPCVMVNMFAQCKIVWHGQGDYLAVKVDRFVNSRKKVCMQHPCAVCSCVYCFGDRCLSGSHLCESWSFSGVTAQALCFRVQSHSSYLPFHSNHESWMLSCTVLSHWLSRPY